MTALLPKYNRLSIYENRVLGKMMKDETKGDCRKLLHNLYSSLNIIGTIKSEEWTGNTARMGRKEGVEVVVGSQKKEITKKT